MRDEERKALYEELKEAKHALAVARALLTQITIDERHGGGSVSRETLRLCDVLRVAMGEAHIR